MTLTGQHLYIAVAAAAATVAVIVWRAPSLQAGLNRLTLIHNTLGIAVVFAGWSVGIALFVWGVVAVRKDLIYFSFMPMVLAGLAYNFITRRHKTWYGIFGFDDSRERWRSFWDETRKLWGFAGQSSHAPSSTARIPSGGLSAPPPAGPTRSFSISFGTRSRSSGAGLLGPIMSFAASRLATGHITVFPSVLQFVMVRRRDGGHLQLAVAADPAFLDATAGPRNFDGSHTVTVRLIAAKLTPGPFRGSIVIETGDPVEPQLTVPVVGTVA